MYRSPAFSEDLDIRSTTNSRLQSRDGSAYNQRRQQQQQQQQQHQQQEYTDDRDIIVRLRLLAFIFILRCRKCLQWRRHSEDVPAYQNKVSMSRLLKVTARTRWRTDRHTQTHRQTRPNTLPAAFSGSNNIACFLIEYVYLVTLDDVCSCDFDLDLMILIHEYDLHYNVNFLGQGFQK